MKRKVTALVIILFSLMISGSVFAEGYLVTSDLWIRAVINTVEKGHIEAVWQKGGEDSTSRGDRVIWGHFYASPSDVTWGSQNNPDLFVKIWFDVSGRVDVNFFHVSVPDIEVYSDYVYDGNYDQQGTTTMSRRYIRQYYENSQSYSDENYEDGNPPSGYLPTGNPSGYSAINDLRIGTLINTVEKGPIDGLWQLGGQDTTSRGDQVIWGLFYASPDDVTWGSQNNPDLFVKIWFDVSGRVDVNFFHVSVPDIEVYSNLPSDGTYDQQGTTVMNNRYIRHEYWSDGGGGGGTPPKEKTIEVGEATIVITTEIYPDGGWVDIDSPGDPIDGLSIEIPEGAYKESVNFTVSHSPIISHSLGENFNPVTPLITITNGSKYSDKIMSVRIPVAMKDNYHYMAFYYDDATGELEGLPELDHDETSLTIATKHFSDIVVNEVLGFVLILGDFDSGFQVTKDNWQFENIRTYLSVDGICSGMSTSSLHYYIEEKKKRNKPQLFGRYGENTPGFGIDDDLAIKLSATAQWYEDNDGALDNFEGKSDLWTFLMFAHAILTTGEPQYVAISPAGSDIGHAMVVYKKSGNYLYVADPILPNDQNVTIEFEWGDENQTDLTGTFKPFESQWNIDSDKIDFTEVAYSGYTALVDREDLDELWRNMDQDQQTVGEEFPDYSLKIIETNSTGSERKSVLTDGYITTNSVIKVEVETYNFEPRLTAYAALSDANNIEPKIVQINLNPGKNKIGFHIEAEKLSEITNQNEWVWTDFKYITIEQAVPWPNYPNPEYCSMQGEGSFSIGDPTINGTFILCSYHENRQLGGEGPYKDGKRNGVSKHYYENGQLHWEIPYTDGKHNGLERLFYENGQIDEERPYTDGKRNGVWKGYFESGQLRYERPYRDGKENGVWKVYYYESGQLKTVRPYTDGKRNGVWKWYYENGRPKYETPYIDDKRDGVHKEYYEIGQVMREYPYTDDKRNGVCKYYYESGQLKTECHYTDDKRNGVCKVYFEGGSLRSCWLYEDGIQKESCM